MGCSALHLEQGVLLKVQLTFKTPDVAYEATQDLPDEEQLAAEVAISKWVKYGEYLTVEIDTETDECKVIPV